MFKCCPSLPFWRVLIYYINGQKNDIKIRLDRATFADLTELQGRFENNGLCKNDALKRFVAGISHKVWNTFHIIYLII